MSTWTDEKHEAARARCEAATEGPWESCGGAIEGGPTSGRDALRGWRSSVETYRMMAEHLSAERITDETMHAFLDKFMPMPDPVVTTERVQENAEQSRGQWRSIYRSETMGSLTDTRWGLVQASVEYLNHSRRAFTKESAFKRAYLDQSHLTAKATEIAQLV